MRVSALALGLIALTAAWLGPLPALAHNAFAAHMAMHVLVVAVAAPLIAVGLAGSRADPAVHRPRWFAPVPASVGELIVVWGWHVPGLHMLARGDGRWLMLEQASFLLVGLWLWLSAFGGDVHARRERHAGGIGGLLMTSMHMTLLGALLALAPRVLYEHPLAHGGGLTPLQDQQWGGVLMLLGGGTAYLIGGLYLMVQLLRGSQPFTGPRP